MITYYLSEPGWLVNLENAINSYYNSFHFTWTPSVMSWMWG